MLDGWRLAVSSCRERHAFYVRDRRIWAQYDQDIWVAGVVEATVFKVDGMQVLGARQLAISAPSGGAIIDIEGRAALASVLAALRTHGLISL